MSSQAGARVGYVCLSSGTAIFLIAPYSRAWRILWLGAAIICCSGAFAAAFSLSGSPRDARGKIWAAILLNLAVVTFFLISLIWFSR